MRRTATIVLVVLLGTLAQAASAQRRHTLRYPYGCVEDLARRSLFWQEGDHIHRLRCTNSKFFRAEFDSLAYFSEAEFASLADFSEAEFASRAYFSFALFDSLAYFSEAEFASLADFSEAEFAIRAYLARGERACHEPQTKRCFSWDLANRLVLEFRVQRESALEHGKPR